MILAGGKLYDSREQNAVLSGLEARINQTLAGPRLEPETVIRAFDRLSQKIAAGEYETLIRQLPIDNLEQYVTAAVNMLRRESLEFKVKTELGEDFTAPARLTPPYAKRPVVKRVLPLGTLFHIAAGNVDGLPAYSVAEGLVTGNVNILKLPQADNGLSVAMIARLLELEPGLSDYIYVFDTPSEDIAAMKQMAELSDGIVVWGGDAAVSAVRGLAPTGVKLIEWGHKLSFAYVSGASREQLSDLAGHVMRTKQLLCSSCQTVFVDTDSMEELYAFCEAFLPMLEQAALRFPENSPGAAAQITLQLYNAQLEQLVDGDGGRRIFRGRGCSLTACEDKELSLSMMFGNCLVKRLPRRELLPALRRKRHYLQTAGLLCPEQEREALTLLLLKSGVVKVARAGEMSEMTCCDAHDGEYPLRRYLRMTDSF